MENSLKYSDDVDFFRGDFNQQVNQYLRSLLYNKSKIKRLLISGEHGSGKTKIVSRWVKKLELNRKEQKVVYITANQFVDELLDSLKKQRKNDFFESFYQADIIIIEDLDGFKKKKRSQKELSTLLSELIVRNKKIILTVEKKKLPKKIKKITQLFHLVSIKNPPFGDLKKIARILLNDFHLDEPDSVCYYLCKYFCSSIGELKNILRSYELQCVNWGDKLTIEWLDENQLELIDEG